jgi:hypothetical protein
MEQMENRGMRYWYDGRNVLDTEENTVLAEAVDMDTAWFIVRGLEFARSYLEGTGGWREQAD